MTWRSQFHGGTQSWDAGGRLNHYQVTFSDATSYRWERSGDVGRESVIGWDGETTIVEGVDPPTAEEADR